MLRNDLGFLKYRAGKLLAPTLQVEDHVDGNPYLAGSVPSATAWIVEPQGGGRNVCRKLLYYLICSTQIYGDGLKCQIILTGTCIK